MTISKGGMGIQVVLVQARTCNRSSRFPAGMTTRKASAKATVTAAMNFDGQIAMA
jgi:hypothetical protein